MTEQHVLIVDDTPELVRLLELNLAQHGYVIRTAGTGAEAIAAVRDGFMGCILLDIECEKEAITLNNSVIIIIPTRYT